MSPSTIVVLVTNETDPCNKSMHTTVSSSQLILPPWLPRAVPGYGSNQSLILRCGSRSLTPKERSAQRLVTFAVTLPKTTLLQPSQLMEWTKKTAPTLQYLNCSMKKYAIHLIVALVVLGKAVLRLVAIVMMNTFPTSGCHLIAPAMCAVMKESTGTLVWSWIPNSTSMEFVCQRIHEPLVCMSL
jgi:hypothetical protein